VDHGVGRDLADCGHQVLRAAAREPLVEGVTPDLFPLRREILLAERRSLRLRGRAG